MRLSSRFAWKSRDRIMNNLCCKIQLFTKCVICKDEWCEACWGAYLDERTEKHKCYGEIRYCKRDHEDETPCELT